MTISTKIAFITGGSAGIGRATVREFAAAGCDVAVLAPRPVYGLRMLTGLGRIAD